MIVFDKYSCSINLKLSVHNTPVPPAVAHQASL